MTKRVFNSSSFPIQLRNRQSEPGESLRQVTIGEGKEDTSRQPQTSRAQARGGDEEQEQGQSGVEQHG